jgi:hypothetical protein
VAGRGLKAKTWGPVQFLSGQIKIQLASNFKPTHTVPASLSNIS